MSKRTLLSLGHAKLADHANDRVCKIRVQTLNSQYRAAIAALESEFEKKFKIHTLVKKVRGAKKKLRDAEHALEDAKDAAKKAARAEVSKIESRRAASLEAESNRTLGTSLTILGATLPEDICKALALEETKKMIAVGV